MVSEMCFSSVQSMNKLMVTNQQLIRNRVVPRVLRNFVLPVLEQDIDTSNNLHYEF